MDFLGNGLQGPFMTVFGRTHSSIPARLALGRFAKTTLLAYRS
jgi:hypothetical protein